MNRRAEHLFKRSNNPDVRSLLEGTLYYPGIWLKSRQPHSHLEKG